MNARVRIALLYMFFAAIATAANLLTQRLAVELYRGSFALVVSVLAGTAIGLGVKFALDKLWIFKYKSRSAAHDLKLLILYGTTGVVTTLVFWAFEFSFYFIFADKSMRYVGAVMGLSLGYWMKYRMDRKMVFVGKQGDRA